MDSDSGEIFISCKSERRRAAEHPAETLRLHGRVLSDDEPCHRARSLSSLSSSRLKNSSPGMTFPRATEARACST